MAAIFKNDQVTVEAYVPPLYATDTGRQFEPETETHHTCITLKVVDPGCTLEFQMEELSGRVTRITTTDGPEGDREQITAAVLEALGRMFKQWGI